MLWQRRVHHTSAQTNRKCGWNTSVLTRHPKLQIVLRERGDTTVGLVHADIPNPIISTHLIKKYSVFKTCWIRLWDSRPIGRGINDDPINHTCSRFNIVRVAVRSPAVAEANSTDLKSSSAFIECFRVHYGASWWIGAGIPIVNRRWQS